MNNDIIQKFNKYEIKGPDYHYKQIDKRNRAFFNAYVLARYQMELQMILKIIKNRNNQITRILDVGCGDGVMLSLINKKIKNNNIKLYGIDSSEIAIDIAKEKVPDAKFKVADVYNIPFDDNFFDLIISSDVIEHLSQPKRMLNEIKRVGENFSKVIIGTPIRYTEFPVDRTEYHIYFPLEFNEILCEFFQNIKLIQSHKLIYLLLYEKRFRFFKIKIMFYRSIINFLTIYFNRNPFLKFKKKDNEVYSYLFGLADIKK